MEQTLDVLKDALAELENVTPYGSTSRIALESAKDFIRCAMLHRYTGEPVTLAALAVALLFGWVVYCRATE